MAQSKKTLANSNFWEAKNTVFWRQINHLEFGSTDIPPKIQAVTDHRAQKTVAE